MTTALFAPRADHVDDTFWIETSQTSKVTEALWRLLALAREEPPRWFPRVVLCGEPGVGKTTLARRFVRATKRSVACDLVAERLATLDALRADLADAARLRAERWAEAMTRGVGHCPEACSPAAWMPADALARILDLAQGSHPTEMLEMSARPGSALGFALPRPWRSPGDEAGDPIRRTSLAIVDDADRLLRVGRAKRGACLDQMEHSGGAAGHRVLNVYVGSPELAEALAECGTTQVVTLRPMPCDDQFAAIARMVFGPVTADELTRLHAISGGRMGPLVHLAAMRGLEPPYAVPANEILRLPAPAATRDDGRSSRPAGVVRGTGSET